MHFLGCTSVRPSVVDTLSSPVVCVSVPESTIDRVKSEDTFDV